MDIQSGKEKPKTLALSQKQKGKKKEKGHKSKKDASIMSMIQKYGPSALTTTMNKAMPYLKKGYMTYKMVEHAMPYLEGVIEMLFSKLLTLSTPQRSRTLLEISDKVATILADPESKTTYLKERQLLVSAFTGGAQMVRMPVMANLQSTWLLTMSNSNLYFQSSTPAVMPLEYALTSGYSSTSLLFDEYQWKPDFGFQYFSLFTQGSPSYDYTAVGAIDYDSSGAITSAVVLWSFDTARMFRLMPTKTTGDGLTCSWKGKLKGDPDDIWSSTVPGNVPVAYFKTCSTGFVTGQSQTNVGYMSFTGEIMCRQALN